MKAWQKLSPLTRGVVVLVVLTCVGMTYHKQRVQPLQARLADHEDEIAELQDDLDVTLIQVERLRTEANAAERYSSYALILDRQTTGQSFHDLLDHCGTGSRPDLEVRQLEFERVPPERGFPALAVRFQLYGPYQQIVDFLHDLDEAFPPVELTRSSLTLAEDDEELEGTSGWVLAQLEGVVHEPK